MTLAATLGGKLDGKALVDGIVTELAEPLLELAGIELPIELSDLEALATDADGLDLQSFEPLLERLASEVPTLLARLPGAGDVLGPLGRVTSLVESVATDDLETSIRSLLGKLEAELRGQGEGGLASLLLRLANLLNTAPESRSLGDLLRSAGEALGVRLPATPAGDLLTSFDGTLRSVGGLMLLESTLAEGEHLTRVLSARLDPERVARRVEQLNLALAAGPVTLAAVVNTVAGDDELAVANAVNAVTRIAVELQELGEDVAAGMGLGEAALVHLPPAELLTKTQLAISLLQGADAAALGRITSTIAEALRPVLNLPIWDLPAQSLDQLFELATAQVAVAAEGVAQLDVAALATPLETLLNPVNQALTTLNTAIDEVVTRFRAAMLEVKAAIAALPFGEVAKAITDVLTPVSSVLDAIREAILAIETALDGVAEQVKTILGGVETTLDGFAAEFDALFGAAKEYVLQLNLDAVISAVNEQIQSFTNLLAQVQMKPTFDTAVQVIGTTRDVVSNIPFGLLPDDVKSEIDAAVKPIKEVDVGAVEVEIESILQIGPDGKFALRDDIEAGLTTIQEQYDALLQTLEEYNPRGYLQALDEKLRELATQVEGISPELTLEPVRAAVDRVKTAIVGIDLRAQLAPVQDVFDQILAGIDQYSPSALVQPIQAQLEVARAKVKTALQFEVWMPQVAGFQTQAEALLGRIDTQQTDELITFAHAQATQIVNLPGGVQLGAGIGTLLVGLLRGLGVDVTTRSVDRVFAWLNGAPLPSGATTGADDCNRRAGALAAAVLGTHEAVSRLDLAATSTTIVAQCAALRAAAQTLSTRVPAGSSAQRQLEAALPLLDAAAICASLEANRQRYLARLSASLVSAETLRRTGYSQVDDTLARLRTALAPFDPYRTLVSRLAALLGIELGEGGATFSVANVLRPLLTSFSPARLSSLVTPLVVALRERISALLNAVFAPVNATLENLIQLIDALDLSPLSEAMDLVVSEIKAQIQAFSPLSLLEAPLGSFEALQNQLVESDPLAQVFTIIDEVQAVIVRVLGKLSVERLLASPLEMYDHIARELHKLQLDGLLTPLLDQLDVLASDVDTGLDATVEAFRGLQEALPGGSSSASASASLEVG